MREQGEKVMQFDPMTGEPIEENQTTQEEKTTQKEETTQPANKKSRLK